MNEAGRFHLAIRNSNKLLRKLDNGHLDVAEWERVIGELEDVGAIAKAANMQARLEHYAPQNMEDLPGIEDRLWI